MQNGKDVRPRKWSNVIDLYDNGWYSAIWGIYDDSVHRMLGVRWNGEEDESKGFPLSSGHSVWYVEPDFLAKDILSALLEETISNPNAGGNKENIITAMSELLARHESNRIHLAVALYAAGGRGKTTTLKKLIEELKSAGAVTLEERSVFEGSLDTVFAGKAFGKTVGVATGGDTPELIEKAFEFFYTYNCDIVFCATRSRSDSWSWRTFYEKTYSSRIRVQCVRKRETEAGDQERVNQAQAKELMQIIKCF